MTYFEELCRDLLDDHVGDANGLCVWCTHHYGEPIVFPCPRWRLANRSLTGYEVGS